MYLQVQFLLYEQTTQIRLHKEFSKRFHSESGPKAKNRQLSIRIDQLRMTLQHQGVVR